MNTVEAVVRNMIDKTYFINFKCAMCLLKIYLEKKIPFIS